MSICGHCGERLTLADTKTEYRFLILPVVRCALVCENEDCEAYNDPDEVSLSG